MKIGLAMLKIEREKEKDIYQKIHKARCLSRMWSNKHPHTLLSFPECNSLEENKAIQINIKYAYYVNQEF